MRYRHKKWGILAWNSAILSMTMFSTKNSLNPSSLDMTFLRFDAKKHVLRFKKLIKNVNLGNCVKQEDTFLTSDKIDIVFRWIYLSSGKWKIGEFSQKFKCERFLLHKCKCVYMNFGSVQWLQRERPHITWRYF